MLKNNSLLAVFLALIWLISGCASSNKDEDANLTDKVNQQIADAADRIQRVQLELYQAGAINSVTTKQEIHIEEGDRISINWAGDAHDLLRVLTRSRGETYTQSGIKMPLPVSIDVKNIPYRELLTMISAQIGYRATIVHKQTGMILEYNQPGNQ